MRLTDRYDGAADPFEGERTIVWASLPREAVVTKATITLEPLSPSGDGVFVETLRLGSGSSAFGATLTRVIGSPSYVDVDFHGRRRGHSISGISGTTSLAVDVGGGVFTAVGEGGTLPPAPPGSVYSVGSGSLPDITASRLRFLGATAADPNAVSIDVLTQPSNVTLRFGKLPTFWSKVGELAVATTTPDITDAIQRALSLTVVVNGYYSIPLIVHSDTLGRIRVTIDVTYVGSAQALAPGLREVLLPYDHATVAKADASALQVILPVSARVLPGQTSLQVRGAFEQSRVVEGPTGAFSNSDTLTCSATQVLAQPLTPTDVFDLSAIDVLVATQQPAARLALDIRSDQSGKPSQTSLLAKPLPFDLTGSASGTLQWTTVPITPSVRINKGTTYWLVLQALDGSALFGTVTGALGGNIAQRSVDSGFSWRVATPLSSVCMRLRNVPDRFQMPIDFVAGSGSNQQRRSLQAYNAQGKVDAILDRPELATAIESYVSQTAPAACAQGERLQNPDFAEWSTSGTNVGAGSQIFPPSASGEATAAGLAVVETFFDTVAQTLPESSATADAFVYSADGTTIIAALPPQGNAGASLILIDTATFETTPLLTNLPQVWHTTSLAVDSGGQTLYSLIRSTGATGSGATGSDEFLAIDLASRKLSVLASDLQNPDSLVLSSDGRSAYFADHDVHEPAIFAIDLDTRIVRKLIDTPAASLALSADGKILIAIAVGVGKDNKQIQCLDTASGLVNWSLELTAPGPFAAATADDGSDFYVAAVDLDDKKNPVLTLLSLDRNGNVTPKPTQAGIDFRDTASLHLQVKPQGDRVYVATERIALDPAGAHLLVPSTARLAAFQIGSRYPSAWTLTTGSITPQATGDTVPAVAAALDNGSLSQVIAIDPSCFHDFSVRAFATQNQPQQFNTGINVVVTMNPIEAVVEVLWLDAGGTLLRTDSLPVPQATQPVNLRGRFQPPAGSAQSEVRARVTGGILQLQRVSLQSSDDVLRQDAWQSDGLTGRTFGINGSGRLIFRNIGTADVAFSQRVTLGTSGEYQLSFVGSAVTTPTAAPRIEVVALKADGSADAAAQQIATVDAIGFGARPARISIPATSSLADVRIVLPPGTSLTVDEFELKPRATLSVPLSFVAQSPGELHVSNGQVVYDLKDPTGPAAPPGGLGKPTPPDGTPGEGSCGCDAQQMASTAAAPVKSIVLPRPTGAAIAGALKQRARTAGVLESPQPGAAKGSDIPLTSVKGVGPARARLLQSAGILTAIDLARATTAKVLEALESSPALTSELASSLIASAVEAVSAPESESDGTS